MAIAALYNVPRTPQDLADWSFAHAAHHADINRVIYERHQVTIAAFVLDPFDPNNTEAFDTWLYQHQAMHTQQNSVLGISGFDLTDLDWQDVESLVAWIDFNGNEHVQAGTILQIG